MVLISSKKYACETCIKGHRSSTCKHTDRPLYEIKKKGRPVTQCEHCRELRKTKQVHVKCICEVKTEAAPSQPPSNGKKGTKIPHSAAFPNGLPQELEVTVASHVQEGSPSDSHHGVKEQCSCTCKSGGPCVCWTPRHGAARRNTISDMHAGSLQAAIADIPSPVGQPQVQLSMSHILARVKELRPVLPRPPSSDSSGNGPVHDLASGLPHSHPNRHHLHDNVMFSPYGRAHDRSHDHPLHHPPIPSLYQPSVKGEFFFDRSVLELNGSTPQDLLGDYTLMSASGEVLSADTATCLECSSFISSISASVQQDENQRVAIDEWLRQVPVPQSTSEDAVLRQGVQEYPSSVEKPYRPNHSDSALGPWDKATLFPPFNHSAQPSSSSDDGRTHASTPDYCGHQCSCPPRSCQCRDRGSFCNSEAYSSMNGRMLDDDERFSLLQMSQGMSRSDTHLVLPDLYQTRPFSAPLQKSLASLRPGVSTMTDLPYSVSMSALDVTGGADYMGNSQSVVQALLDFPVTSNTSLSVPNLVLPWLAGSDGGNLASGIMPPMYPYAMSSSGTDGTSSSYDDLSMTLRTPL